MSNKILFFLLIILVSFSLAEGIYFFLYKPSTKLKPESSFTSNRLTSPTPTGSAASQKLSQGDPTQAFSEILLARLRLIRQSQKESVILTNEYKGTLVELNIGEQRINNIIYKASFRIKGRSNDSNAFYLMERDLNPGILILKDFSSLNDIKVGDTITIKETLDLTKNWGSNRIEFTIAKM